jgi:hypothetical protein
MLVIAGGEVLFIASLLFGSTKYTQALAQHLDTNERDAEKAKLTSRLNATDADSPLQQVTRQLESELRTAVEHWRSQEQQQLANKMFAKIWLSGGGACLDGLAEHLGRTYGCPAELLGLVVPETGESKPSMVTALGLALQGLDRAEVAISLCPPEISWLRQRMRRFVYLAAASVLCVAFVAGLMFRYYRRLVDEEKDIASRMEELQKCQGLIPKLEEKLNAIRHHERMLLPFVEKGNRARRFLATIEELAKARDEGDWFVYLADEEAYDAGKQLDDPGGGGPEPPDARPRPKRPEAGALLLLGPATAAAEPEDAPDYPVVVQVRGIKLLEAMIVSGCTPFAEDKPYERVREIVKKLDPSAQKEPSGHPTGDKQQSLFEGVDLLPEPLRAGREDIFEPWLEFFKKLSMMLGNRPGSMRRRGPVPTRYKAFTLRLPFAQLDVNPDVLSAKDAN